jgi:hypothetical protein
MIDGSHGSFSNESKKEKPYACQYCHRRCIKSERAKKRFWWHSCSTCSVRFLVSITGMLVETEFYSTQNNKKYSILIEIKSNKTNLLIDEPDHYDRFNRIVKRGGKELIKSFDKIIDVTPQNLDNKIKTILTFL